MTLYFGKHLFISQYTMQDLMGTFIHFKRILKKTIWEYGQILH